MTGMKDQYFGVEVEMTGITREQAAQALADYFGTIPQYKGGVYDAWVVKDTENKEWKLVSDSSIRGEQKTSDGYARTGDRHYWVEMVSPKLTYVELPKFQECVRQMRHAGGKVNDSCGIHIHVGLGQHTPASLRRLVNLVNAKEDLLTQALGISPGRRARWCRPVNPEFLNELNRRKPDTMEALAQLWYHTNNSGYTDWRRHAASHYDMSRYHLLNLHAAFSTERPAHTIEFRAFNGTLHAGEIKSYIQLCLAISHQALTAKAASPARPDTDNPKYTFRCWLLRLGFIGDEFETARLHLTKRLPGNAAWRQAS